MKARDNLYSDAMDVAVMAYCMARGAGDAEDIGRTKIAAAIDAYNEEMYPERSGTAREAPSTF